MSIIGEKTYIFNLNGTLTEAKAKIDVEMLDLLKKLITQGNYIGIMTGSSWKALQHQIVYQIPEADQYLLNFIYPLTSNGNAMYSHWSRYGWIPEYETGLSDNDHTRVKHALNKISVCRDKCYGKQIEYFVGQYTFAAMGHNAPIHEKLGYDLDRSKRKEIASHLAKELYDFEVYVSGTSSIDIVKRGMNKKFGIDKLMARVRASKGDVMYIGNEIFEGGADSLVQDMGLNNYAVSSVKETKEFIRKVVRK